MEYHAPHMGTVRARRHYYLPSGYRRSGRVIALDVHFPVLFIQRGDTQSDGLPGFECGADAALLVERRDRTTEREEMTRNINTGLAATYANPPVSAHKNL